jgi:hypothetical protein
MKEFKTPKGTTLPLLNLKGKDYLQAAYRIVWFREERPTWHIETEYIVLKEDHAVAKATIKDDQGHIMATAHKQESARGFADFIEKAETGAIGRALAMVGFGTQFAVEFDEDERIVDSPLGKINGPVVERTDFITEPQQKRLFAIAKKSGWEADFLKNYLKKNHHVEHTSEISWRKYNDICSYIENHPVPEQGSILQ